MLQRDSAADYRQPLAALYNGLVCIAQLRLLVTLYETHIVRSRLNSDLEAFSPNSTDGSVAALAFQLTAVTNYLNQRFLSY